MNGLKRGALAVGVAGLLLSAGAAGFSSGAATSGLVPPRQCATLDAHYDALEAHSTGAATTALEAAEHRAQLSLGCGSDIDGGL